MELSSEMLITVDVDYTKLVNHIILPRVLPTCRSNEFEEENSALLKLMQLSIKSSVDLLPTSTVRLFETLTNIHSNRSSEAINGEINALEPGNLFAMFIHKQNTGIMIYMPPEQSDNEIKNVILSTWKGVSSREIYKHSSDLQFDYPSQSLKVKFSKMMRSREFSEQLYFCESWSNRSDWNSIHWLMSILGDENTDQADFPKITKKIRDEVFGVTEYIQSSVSEINIARSNYFRRSQFYVSLKAFLQLSLSIEFGIEQGRFIYKIIMIKFMTLISQQFESYSSHKIDLMAQLIAKIARRIEKLTHRVPGNIGIDILAFYKETVSEAKKIISTLRFKIDEKIESLQKMHLSQAKLEKLTELDFEADIEHKIPELEEYLIERKLNDIHQKIGDNMPRIIPCKRHRIDDKTPPDISHMEEKFQKNEDGKKIQNFGKKNGVYRIDIERWILYNLDFNSKDYDIVFLNKYFVKHAKKVNQFPKDPISCSRMFLTKLKLIAMMDRIAVETYPLLSEHFTGIDTDVFERLLLPHKVDMKIAYEVQKYFDDRNKNAIHPGLIEQYGITSHSFSVKFAKANADMKKTLSEILEKDEEAIQQLKQTWEEKRGKMRSLKQLVDASRRCPSLSSEKRKAKHVEKCNQCYLKWAIKGSTQYTRCLPANENMRNGIVFELRVPNELAILRDALYLMGQIKDNSSINMKKWTADKRLSCHDRSIKKLVNLEYMESYLESSAPDWFLGADEPFETFVIENNHACVFGVLTFWKIKVPNTLVIERYTPYAGLQWTINSISHTQNEVLTRQSECPREITLSEFKSFGSLRADGNRLKFRKLYGMIETEALSFDQIPVLLLILQTIWEMGPLDESGFNREAYEDLIDPQFVPAMIELLNNFTEKHIGDWYRPVKLLIVAFIAVRIFELNDDEHIAVELAKVLGRIRAISFEWINKIEMTRQNPENRSKEKMQSIQLSLIIISTIGAVTFFVSAMHQYFENIFAADSAALKMWLRSIITLKNITSRNAIPFKMLMFMPIVRYIGVNVEQKIRRIIEEKPQDVLDIIGEQWPMFKNSTVKEIGFSADCEQVFVCNVITGKGSSNITIDIVTGKFFVNNLSSSLLPQIISHDFSFKEIFGKNFVEVQPFGEKKYSTIRKIEGCNYTFEFTSELVITEYRDDGNESELIPVHLLGNSIPELLIENHSFWWNKAKNIIEFRPKHFYDGNFSEESGISYRLDLNTNRLIHAKTDRFMLSIQSNSFQKIRDHLLRLENGRYIHVLMDGPKIAMVELTRMNLKFMIDCSHPQINYQMVSNEFKGMRVSLHQNCGTLYGLNNGLLLESISTTNGKTSSKLLIVPYSEVECYRTEEHVSVDIDLDFENLRDPPFHLYRVDEPLRQLKANNSSFSAWFYLAYLHALTSHGEIEPLTGLTGSERALQILQSGVVWSSAPYDDESMKSLKSIADLSPMRQLRNDVQSVEWPHVIRKFGAQDAYLLIVQKLIDDSVRLKSLYSVRDIPVHNTRMLEEKSARKPSQKWKQKLWRKRKRNLNDESGHLKSSHSEDIIEILKRKSDIKLNIRAYARCLQLKPNSKVSELFIKHDPLETRTSSEQIITIKLV